MGEIKISVSEEMDNLIQEIADSLGIKKTEYIKYLVVENLREIKFKESESRGKNGKK